MNVKEIKEQERDYLLTLVKDGDEVKILVPKDLWFWKDLSNEPHGLNLVTYGHYE